MKSMKKLKKGLKKVKKKGYLILGFPTKQSEARIEVCSL